MKWATALLTLLVSAAVLADERILSFHSDVTVLGDGVIEVTETIQVRSEGQQIRLGIYRDFPVDYEDRLGNRYRVTHTALSVLRNDRPEAFHSRKSDRDIRTYFGHSDRFIEPGIHTYVFRYRANRLLGFFDEHDELYWNVTGNRWLFPIDKASATIRFDFDVPRNRLIVEAYTGPLGSRAQEYSRRLDEAGAIHFAANSSLPASHGLTVVVGWPKGLVTEPTSAQRLGWLLSDNKNLLIALAGLILLFAYYIPVWRKHGKDPEEGVIVTRYEPPKGFSPASLRYIRQMYYDDKVMTAAIVNLAVKGYLRIKRKGDTHSVSKLPSDTSRPPMAAGERELYETLFSEDEVVTLKQFNHELLGEVRSAHKESLKNDYNEKYFRTNGALNIIPALIVLACTGLALATSDGPNLLVIFVIAAMFIVMIFFAIIMKRPTLRGQQLLDEMLGFKDYLEIAEKDELNLRNPPEKTPQLFESLLPFALAMGVDQEWSERFSEVLESIREPNGDTYSPSWYDGKWNSSDLSKSTSGLSSGLSSAVSASVSPPGSSSGGGGGGSSGGGGGGGGGGGW
jgi:uncharacterized membrane protein YgcG